jgi:hypothetical protein
VVEHLAKLLPPDVLPLELDAARMYSVSAINAAVIDPEGSVVLIVSLMGFPGTLSGADVETTGQRLRAATAAVTVALAGVLGRSEARAQQDDRAYHRVGTDVRRGQGTT